MECLPDETLTKIFLYLHPKSRLKFETVSLRWCNLMPYDDLKQLDLLDVLVPKERHSQVDTLPMSGALNSVLMRAGPTLTKISFGRQMVLITPTALRLISQHCPNIRELDLSHCKVTENVVDALMLFADHLISLDLTNTYFSLLDPCNHISKVAHLFESFQCLKRIYLQGTSMFNLRAIIYLPDTLEAINLNNCLPLRYDILLEFLTQGRPLTELRLASYNALDDTLLDTICSIDTLKVLDLSRLSFGDLLNRQNTWVLDFSLIAYLPNLEELYITFNNGFNSYALRRVAQNCQKLRVLHVSNCRQLDDFSPLALIVGLKDLNVSATDRFNDEVLASIAENGISLTNLQCYGCPVTDRGVNSIVDASAETLKELSLCDCEAVSDKSVERLLSEAHRLVHLDLQRTQVTDAFMWVLSNMVGRKRNQARVLEIDLSFCKGVTDKGLEVLKSGLSAATDFSGRITLLGHQTKISKQAANGLDKRLVVKL